MAAGSTASDTWGDVQFVDLEGGQLGVEVGVQCSDDAGVHVRAVGLGGDVTEGGQRRSSHSGCGGLAVGAGDDDGASTAAESAEDVRVDLERDEAADHRSLAAACFAGRPGRQLRRAQSHAATCADTSALTHFNHPPSLAQKSAQFHVGGRSPGSFRGLHSR